MSTDTAAPQPGVEPRASSGRDGAGKTALPAAGLMELIQDAVEYRVDDAEGSVA
jgi:hypothetical protein